MAPLGYAIDFPKLTCTAYGKPQGRADKLTAKRVKPGDPAYMEFRLRAALSVPSGHLYVVFGRLDPDGNPVTRQYMGLFPRGGPIGLYAGRDAADAGAVGTRLQRLHFSRLCRLSRLVDAKNSTGSCSPRCAPIWRIRRNGGCSASTAITSRRRWARWPGCASRPTATSRRSRTSTPTSRPTATVERSSRPAFTYAAVCLGQHCAAAPRGRHISVEGGQPTRPLALNPVDSILPQIAPSCLIAQKKCKARGLAKKRVRSDFRFPAAANNAPRSHPPKTLTA